MRTTPERTKTLTTTEAAVLGLLASGAQSGYDLRKKIDRSVGYFWGPAKTQIYAVLPRLEADGYVSRRDVAQDDRPDKQVYRITKSGRAALKEWLEQAPVEPVPDKNPILLKLFFGAHADEERLLEQVRERRQAAEELRRELQAIERGVARAPDDDFFPSLTRRWGYAYADALVRWTNEVERALERRRAKR